MLHPRSRAAVAAAAALAVALPAAAYVLPAPAVLRLAARKRVETAPGAVELRGTFTSGATMPFPAVLSVKGSRCRLELVASDRPFAVVRGGRVAAQRGLDRIPGALALAEGACALLGPTSPDGYAQSFSARGVALQQIALGKLGIRPAWVLGGRPRDPVPQAWIDKQTLVPVRLVADLAGARRDVQLLDYPLPPALVQGEKAAPPAPSDLFPRRLEVSGANGLEARFAVEKVTPGARISDGIL